MSQYDHEISNGKRSRAPETHGAYKRPREPGYPTARDGELGDAYPRHDTTQAMASRILWTLIICHMLTSLVL